MSAPTPEVLIERDGPVMTVTLNAPERHNTISGPMLNALSGVFREAHRDTDVRCMILTGTGRMFCAGLDVKAAAPRADGKGMTGSAATSRTTIDLMEAAPVLLHQIDVPVIAALSGSAAGYGMDMALGCDIRIMAEGAKLSAAFTRIGVLPESGGTWLLPRLVGWEKAAELVFSAATLTAAEAHDLGLVSRVIPKERVLEEARMLADRIASNAPLAVRASKRMMRQALTESFAPHVHTVYLQLRTLLETADMAEGMAAFREKRSPHFTGT